MAMIFDYPLKHGSLSYKKQEDGTILIDSYRGKDTEIQVPDSIAGMPVTIIGKKAFLGAAELVTLTLPSDVKVLEDYAFAGCERLKAVYLPYGRVSLGRGVFQNCDHLEAIHNCVETEKRGKKEEDLAYLLVATTGILEAPYLFDLSSSFDDDWWELWDRRMESKIQMDDAEGFQNMLLCGEEDYGSKETDFDYYKHLKRLAKVKILILRLMHDYALAEEKRDMARTYLLAHCKGCPSEETWDVILQEHSDDKRYFDFLFSLGGVTKENYEGMLLDLGDRHTEMKAHLMKYYERTFGAEDAFSVFAL
ncbi:MAG: leucine-rich repeat domain-containing protein [Lachnospiraceae bacterium]|nr:leucine-rich repeat domain-containing protein [Lachnospiraceae bacterium]